MALWTNWAGDQRCAPEAIERPSSEAELQELVAATPAIRAVGSGHSFSDIACSDGRLVSLERLGEIVAVVGDLVRVQAGANLHELGPDLARRGLAMENLGDIDAQVLAGAVSTGTHGTGERFRNISATVEGMRLVVADGSVVSITDPEELRSARVGLGALGVISELTLRCVPLYNLRRVDRPRPLGEVLEAFDELARGHDHFEFFVLPHTDVAMVRTSERTGSEPKPLGRMAKWLKDDLTENHAFGLVSRIGRRFPAHIPALNRGGARLWRGDERLDHSHSVFANRRDVRFTEMEYAIPRAAGPEAVRRVMELCARRAIPTTFPLEVRVVAADDAHLSPASGRDCAYIAVHQFGGMDFESYFRGVESIMREYDGRPHWGKRHYRTAADLAPAYPGWDAFQETRAKLDPDGCFDNDFTRRVLGAVASVRETPGPRPGRSRPRPSPRRPRR